MIRVAKSSDIQNLAKMHLASWQVAYRDILPDFVLERLACEPFEQQWKINLSNPGRTDLLLELDGRIVGFISFGANRDDAHTGEIYGLYLHPDFWNAGHGQRLWKCAIANLKPQFSVAILWVLQDNLRARRFYERMGSRSREQAKTIRLHEVDLPEICYSIELDAEQ